MSKKIGILGGMSYESTIKYYDLILKKYYEKFKKYNYPEIFIFSLNFQKIVDYENNNQKQNLINYLLYGIKTLEKSGADFVIMAANSPHNVYNEIINKVKIPMINIAKVTIKKAKGDNLNNLLLLGTKYTMQSTYYHEIADKYNIKIITPDLNEQDEINSIISKELCIGQFNDSSKNKIIDIINKYNIDGVILGCTELPLLLSQKDISINLLNTLEIHVDAALNYSIDN